MSKDWKRHIRDCHPHANEMLGWYICLMHEQTWKYSMWKLHLGLMLELCNTFPSVWVAQAFLYLLMRCCNRGTVHHSEPELIDPVNPVQIIVLNIFSFPALTPPDSPQCHPNNSPICLNASRLSCVVHWLRDWLLAVCVQVNVLISLPALNPTCYHPVVVWQHSSASSVNS